MKKFFIFGLCVVALSSCATIFNGSKARIVLADDKATDPVDLTIDGVEYSDVLLPARVKVKRGFKDSKVVAEARDVPLRRSTSVSGSMALPCGISHWAVFPAWRWMPRPER